MCSKMEPGQLPGIAVAGFSRLEEMPPWTSLEELVTFFSTRMRPYHDTPEDVRRGVLRALSKNPGEGGFVLLVREERSGELVGGLTMLKTGMKGYVPENLLLFVAVDPHYRGRGIGGVLIRDALQRVDGAVKLHVEEDNPARRLYTRNGFQEKYVEMRWTPSTTGGQS